MSEVTAFLCELRDQPDLRQDWFQRAYAGYTKFGRGLLAVHFSHPDHLRHDLRCVRAHDPCRFRVAYIGQNDTNLEHLSPTLPLAELKQTLENYSPLSQFVVLAHLLLADPANPLPGEADKSTPLSSRAPVPAEPAAPRGLTPSLDKYCVIAGGRVPPSASTATLDDIAAALGDASLAASPTSALEAGASATDKQSGMTREDREKEIEEAKRQLADKGMLDGEMPADLREQFRQYLEIGAPIMRVMEAPGGPTAVCLRRHDDPPPEHEFATFLADLLVREQRWAAAHPTMKK